MYGAVVSNALSSARRTWRMSQARCLGSSAAHTQRPTDSRPGPMGRARRNPRPARLRATVAAPSPNVRWPVNLAYSHYGLHQGVQHSAAYRTTRFPPPRDCCTILMPSHLLENQRPPALFRTAMPIVSRYEAGSYPSSSSGAEKVTRGGSTSSSSSINMLARPLKLDLQSAFCDIRPRKTT